MVFLILAPLSRKISSFQRDFFETKKMKIFSEFFCSLLETLKISYDQSRWESILIGRDGYAFVTEGTVHSELPLVIHVRRHKIYVT